MAKSLTVKDIKEEVEHVLGRQPENYIIRLVNDALLDIGTQRQHYTISALENLVPYQRWYTLSDDVIDILKVEILDDNDRYIKIPKLADAHNLLRADSDADAETLK